MLWVRSRLGHVTMVAIASLLDPIILERGIAATHRSKFRILWDLTISGTLTFSSTFPYKWKNQMVEFAMLLFILHCQMF